jgi:hypothetical protein
MINLLVTDTLGYDIGRRSRASDHSEQISLVTIKEAMTSDMPAPHWLPGLTRPYMFLCFFFEARGCNWSTIRLKVAWSAALRLLR